MVLEVEEGIYLNRINAIKIPGIIAIGVKFNPNLTTIKIAKRAPAAFPKFPPKFMSELPIPFFLPP